ncbi:MAG: hypothetical protein ABI899_08295, partial [Actinomycetota bacterium]
IRSERPAFDLHHPEAAQYDTPAADKNILDTLLAAPDHDREGEGTQRRAAAAPDDEPETEG